MTFGICSILLLKELPTPIVPNSPSQQTSCVVDPYSDALHSAFKQQYSGDRLKIEYLPPMNTVYPETTLLSRAIAAGYPPGHPQCTHSEFGSLWAFAVTSQNPINAIEAALQHQPNPAIRKAWLQIPIYCLTGATLASVKKAGFTTINPSASSDSSSQAPSLDNAAQLVDFLISLQWPTNDNPQQTNSDTSCHLPMSNTDSSPPELWFLTGETRMKTLAEKLSAHQKAFREVIVYETRPRPGFEEAISNWLARAVELHSDRNKHDSSKSKDQINPLNDTIIAPEEQIDLWLVGFSPKGIDLTIPVLKTFLESSKISSISVPVKIQWGSIGPTTATRIQEYIHTGINSSSSKITLSSTVAVAKSPKPIALADAMALHVSA